MSSSRHYKKRLILLASYCWLTFSGHTTKTYLSDSLSLLMPLSRAGETFQFPECHEGQRAGEWHDVLRYGTGVRSHIRELPPVGREGDVWYVWITYRKRLYVFISQAWGAPGAVERLKTGIAWHGECVLRLAEWFP